MKRSRLSRSGIGVRDVRLTPEVQYADFPEKAKSGFDKFQRLPSESMSMWFRKFKSKTGMNALDVENKVAFYEFMDASLSSKVKKS
jgi:hypothetical protein